MRALSLTVLALHVAACGGLDNTPLRFGVIRGVVKEPTADSLVFVEEAPTRHSRPGADGRFELTSVPQGEVTLVVLASPLRAERQRVSVGGAMVAELGSVGAAAGVPVEFEVSVPSRQRREGAVFEVAGVPLSQRVERGEVQLALPSGCLPVRVSLRGLGDVEREVCVERERREVRFALPPPDGSPGREGCPVTGCDDGYTCRSSGACE
ncbi:MAG: hypothetical protein JNJ54_25160 [Myxococcaceae bacterium]|nr:hypothetical protein [Myxococcaceae bacterium]